MGQTNLLNSDSIRLIKSGTVTTGENLIAGVYAGYVDIGKTYKIIIPIVLDSDKTNQVYTTRISAKASKSQVSFACGAANCVISYEIYGC